MGGNERKKVYSSGNLGLAPSPECPIMLLWETALIFYGIRVTAVAESSPFLEVSFIVPLLMEHYYY
jgi:hypothetical protein